MASLGHTLEYLAARAGMALACSLSARSADAFGVRLGRIAHRLLASRRRMAFDNMKAAMGDSLDDARIEELVRQVFENMGRTVVELSRFRKIGPEGVRRLVDPAGFEPVHEALSRGKGAIIASAHFGNWELMGVYPSACGIPADMIVLTQHNTAVNGLIVGLRRSIGTGIHEVPSQIRGVFKALRQNRLILLAADQHSASASMVLDFMGRPAAVYRGPAIFAVRCGCPVIPMLMRRESYDRHVIAAGDPIYPDPGRDEEENVRKITAGYFTFLEKQIRTWPEQWLWTHNRWKLKQPEGNPDGAET